MTTEETVIVAVWMICSFVWLVLNDRSIAQLRQEVAELRETYWFIQNDKTINQLKKEIAELSEFVEEDTKTPVEKALSRTGEQ